MLFRKALKWSVALVVLVASTAAVAQQDRRASVRGTSGTPTPTGTVVPGSSIQIGQEQNVVLSREDQIRLASGLVAQMEAAAKRVNALKDAAKDKARRDCLDGAAGRLRKAVSDAKLLLPRVGEIGVYSGVREKGRTAKEAEDASRQCPNPDANAAEGSSATMSVTYVLPGIENFYEFPVLPGPSIVLPPPCASCIR